MAITRIPLVALWCAIALVLVLMVPTQANAQQGVSASRSISPSPVPAGGGEATVTINIAGYSGIGSVVETLPAGFSYVVGSVIPAELEPMVSGREVTFSLVGETSFTYRVTAPASPGSHEFSGVFAYGIDKTPVQIGTTTLMVEGTAPTGVSASRSISPSPVPAGGGEATVTINIVGYSGIGSVVETLPAGFSYVVGSVIPAELEPMVSGREVTFSLVGETSFTYRVTAPASPGSHEFSGVFAYGIDKTPVQIGTTTLMVEGTAPTGVSASRSISPSPVPAGGGEATVTINIVGYSGIGSVVETLPAGFSYVVGSVIPAELEPMASGREVTFSLVGETSFTYRVTAPASPGPHEFSGVLAYGIDKTPVEIGTTTLMVEGTAPTGVSVSRSISPSPVPAGGGEVTVTINIVGYSGIGSVVETLPPGFSYVVGSVMPPELEPTVSGREVAFSLVGETSFTYRVTAPASPGPHEFTGVLTYGIEKTPVQIGTSNIRVGMPTRVRPPSRAPTNRAPSFEEGASAMRSVAENSAAGTAVGDPITATDREDDDITYSLVSGDTQLFDINKSNGQLSVAEGADLDFEFKRTHSVTARAMDDGGKLDNINVSISITDVDEEGIIEVSAEAPELGGELTVSLTDPDGTPMVVSWRWERSSDQVTWTAIEGAVSETYTASEADEGQYLRAIAMYTDVDGAEKESVKAFANPVPVAPAPTPEPTPTPVPATPAPTPMPTPTPVPATPAPTPMPTPTPVPATPAPTPVPTPTPVPATPAPTATPVPATPAPTATPVPATPAPTATPVPPTPTATPVTATVAPAPEATPVPTTQPTVEPTVAPEVEEEGGFPLWALILIIVVAVLVVGGGAAYVVRSRIRT